MTLSYRRLALVPALALAAACSKEPKQDVDAALANDLSLAGQSQPAQQYVSPAELGADSLRYAPAPALVEAPAPAPARASTARRTSTRRVASTTRRRTTSPARTSSGSGSTSGSSNGTYEPVYTPAQPATREVEVKHTKRDAAIGAAAGAVIGATTSRDKVKGAVIGAAAGGLLGAIIGNNVDKSKKTVPNP